MTTSSSFRSLLLAAALLSFAPATFCQTLLPPASTAADVIARYAEALGGLDAWRKVETMVWLGHTAGADPSVQSMPFVMQMKRPNAVRFEISGTGARSTRIFDGVQGWRIRPSSSGGQDVRPFSPEEVGYARQEFVIDGPLLDYEAKGVSVTLEGLDFIEGHQAYRLGLKLPSGAARNVWIDTKTNLALRYDRPSLNPMQPGARVATYYHDYQAVDGLQIPRRIEVGTAQGLSPPQKADKLIIDKVLINPKLEARVFARPVLAGAPAVPGNGSASVPKPSQPAGPP